MIEDDPALIVRMPCFILGSSILAVGVSDHGGDHAGGGTGFGGVGTTGQDDGHFGPEYDASSQGVGQIFELFGDHVTGFQVGNHQDFGVAGNGRLDAFGFCGDDGDGVVERQGAIEDATLDLPTVSHFAERSGVECGLDFRVDGFDRRQNRNFGFGNADNVGQINRVTDDVGFFFQ